jgi:beta-phosphoglucomutase-like phosphatase (HAD superfamily)
MDMLARNFLTKLLPMLSILILLLSQTSPFQHYALLVHRQDLVWPSQNHHYREPPLDRTVVRKMKHLAAFFTSIKEKEDDDCDGDESIPQKTNRDGLMNWISGSKGNGDKPAMVRPIGLDGQIKGETNDDDSSSFLENSRARIRPNFDALFTGMPSLNDILGSGGNANDNEPNRNDDESENVNVSPNSRDRKSRSKRISNEAVDDTWFRQEQQQIESNYDKILQGMLEQVKNERKQDPNSVPLNAEELIKSVLKQEMETEIKATREKLIEERLETYSNVIRKDVEAMDISKMKPNESVQRLMDESEAEYVKQSRNRLEFEEFLRYEQEAVNKATKDSGKNEEALKKGLTSGENLDQWALDRLKDMAGSRHGTDADEMILDILQENVNQLETAMKKQAKQSNTIKPETMKEWQMYRSIAARIERKKGDSEETEQTRESEIARDNLIMDRLTSWKEYIVKEEGTRKQSGLTRGPKLPFAWQESPMDSETSGSEVGTSSNKAKRIEIRKTLNRMSIEAMESLLEKTDPTRRDKLQNEIDFLKRTLEANDYLDVDESFLDDPVTTSPIDMAGLFSPGDSSASGIDAWDTSPSTNIRKTQFSINFDDDAEDFDRPRTVPPPNTAFFKDVLEENYDLGETFTGDSKLGTFDDQKLEAMYRRAGARTDEERSRIRTQWEEFKEFEKARRLQSGLSDESSNLDKSIRYNMSAVMKDDGDFDASAILASIGPRPSRKKNNNSELDDIDSSQASEVKRNDVIDSLFRSVSAIGGGRYKDDPFSKQQEKSAFEEFVMKESKMRESLDDPNNLALTKNYGGNLPTPTDDEDYAEKVLSSLGNRPKPKRKAIVNEGDFSDRGGVLASEDAGDDEEDDSDQISSSNLMDIDHIPEWLKKENEEARKGQGVAKSFLGNEIDEVFDNDKYEHNMRQLAEYERRRSGRSHQIGIDISDVLGRRDFDDYADFKYDDANLRSRITGQNDESFLSRKASLLDYIELDVGEINALMDHKDSVYSTGVSQYLPRINKPFKEFGAIFRLEGIILDITGLQRRAWTRVAAEFEFSTPSLDDVKLAAVVRPEIVVKDIFGWSDDFLECKKIAAYHRKAFSEVFEAWAKEESISIVKNSSGESNRGPFTLFDGPDDNVSRSRKRTELVSVNEKEIISEISRAWSKVAQEYNQVPPGDDTLRIASTLNPDIAILKVFKWSSDPLVVDRMVRSYRMWLLPEVERQEAIKAKARSEIETGSLRKQRTQTDVMEMHYEAWLSVSKSFGLKEPSTDEVLAAFVINEPEIAAQGFGWSDDKQQLRRYADAFRKILKETLSEDIPKQLDEASNDSTFSNSHSDGSANNREDLFKVSFDAWSTTARLYGYPEPDFEQVQFALSVGPEEAIVSGFDWTTNPAEIAKILRSYRDEIGRIRGLMYTTATETTVPLRAVNSSGPSQDEVYRAVLESWVTVANEFGYSRPDDEQVQFAMSVGPEEAIFSGFCWTNDSSQVAKILERYKAEIAKRRQSWSIDLSLNSRSSMIKGDIPMYKVTPGLVKWIKSLLDVEVECAVVSYLETEQVDTLLELAGVSQLIDIDKRVSASNGYVTDTDMLLGAALRVERRPDHCVLFDTTPYSSLAAHDVEMQSVSLIGPYPRYDLLSADTTAASLDALTAMNIRRLFGERVYDQPLAESQSTDPGRNRRTKTKTRFFDDE